MSDDSPEPAPLPRAHIVDRETTYDKASRIGRAMAGAVFTMWIELLLVLCTGIVLEVVVRRHFRGIVVPAVALAGVLGFVLVRRIVRPEMMSTSMRGGPLDYPSTSWAHAVLDLGYAMLGMIMLLPPANGASPFDDPGFLGGLATVIVAGGLCVLRLVFWRRQRGLD